MDGPLKLPITEQRNPSSQDMDILSTLELVRLFNQADGEVHLAVRAVLPLIAEAIDQISSRMTQGGRLIYMGAGTSGRLGILDASECPPTFNADPEQVIGIIAGGDQAIRRAVEQIEDDPQQGKADLIRIGLSKQDSVVGLAASGHTPYVLGGLAYARTLGSLTVCVCCDPGAALAEEADIAILPVVGPEVLTGSTRLKAGTAQKMVLNMLSTGVMVRLGKTYGNLMVDLQANNAKLRARSRRIVQQACDVDPRTASDALQACDGEVKTAIVMLLTSCTPDDARQKIMDAQGSVRRAITEGLQDG